jgi:hypothetical protein
MAGYFSPDPPQYMAASSPAPAATRGALGLFPGTPDYQAGGASNTAPPATSPPAVELQIRLPGVLQLEAAISMPPWLPELSPVVLPMILNVARRWLEHRMCTDQVEPAGSPPDTTVPDDGD